MAAVKEDLSKIAEKLGLEPTTTTKIIKSLKRDILINSYITNPKTEADAALNQKIAEVYEKWYGIKFKPLGNKNVSTFLAGPPGHGKTTSVRVAAMEVAEAMGMNFIQDPDQDYIPSMNDFLLVTLECAGENSATIFGGIPSKQMFKEADGKEVAYATKLPFHGIACLSKTGMSCLILDDAPNATQIVQNVMLPVIEEQRFQTVSLGRCYVASTGNLGSIDGTNTFKTSSALKNRGKRFFVMDHVKDFTQRAYLKYNDELGDMGMITFLEKNPQFFYEMADPKSEGSFTTPRSLDTFIQEGRNILHSYGGRGRGEAGALAELQAAARSILGRNIGNEVATFYFSMFNGADPIARDAIMNGKLNREALAEKYGDGKSHNDLWFGYSYAASLADYSVMRIRDEADNGKEFNGGRGVPMEETKAYKETTKRFMDAVLQLNGAEFSYALNYFKDKVAIQVSALSEDTTFGKRDLRETIKYDLAKTISSSPDWSGEKGDQVSSILSDYDKTTDARTRRKMART